MGRKVNSQLWAAWRARLSRQETSGLTIAEFCRREQISANSYFLWKRRLRTHIDGSTSQANAAANGPHAVNERTSLHGSEGRFLQVPLTTPPADRSIEFTLVDGTIVRVPSGQLAEVELVLRTLHTLSQVGVSGDRHHA